MTFQIMCEQNCENITAKKPETRTKVSFLFERANILSKSQLVKLAQKLTKANFLRQTLT